MTLLVLYPNNLMTRRIKSLANHGSEEHDKEESNDEDEDQVEEEQSGEVAEGATNQVF